MSTVSAASMSEMEAEDELYLYSAADEEIPFLSPSPCDSQTSSEIVGKCTICSNRRRRSNLIWACCLVWAVPLALAAGRSMGWWGVDPTTTQQQPKGQLVLVQVVFRHGARTPLSDLYWPATPWTNCSQEPLQSTHAAINTSSSSDGSSSSGGGGSSDGGSSSGGGSSIDAGSSSGSGGISLALYDPSGASTPPELSGGDSPELRGGCRMGSLTDIGFQNALDLGQELRQRYIDHYQLLPAQQYSTTRLLAQSTAVRRTVTTLRGVLSGMYPNSTAVVPVAVRPAETEIMTGDPEGCATLGNLTAQLTEKQLQKDAADAQLHAFEGQLRSALQLPPDSNLLWSRLRDEYACMEADGRPPAVAAAQPRLMTHLDHVALQHKVEVSAPELKHCLLGKQHHQQECQQVTALTIGRLLHELLHNMQAATSISNTNSSSSSDDTSSGDRSTSTARKLLSFGRSDGSNSSSSSGSSSGRGDDDDLPQKMVLFSAHDTTLIPLLTALGQHQSTWPGFANHLAFELWADGDQHFVRVLHNGQPLKLPLLPGAAGGGEHLAGSAGGLAAAFKVLDRPAGRAVDAGRVALRAVAGFFKRLLLQLRGSSSQNSSSSSSSNSSSSSVAAVGSSPVAAAAAAAGSTQLQWNGEDTGGPEEAFVVELEDFKQRVLGDYVITPKDYIKACGS